MNVQKHPQYFKIYCIFVPHKNNAMKKDINSVSYEEFGSCQKTATHNSKFL